MPTDDEWRVLLPQIARIAAVVGQRKNASPTVRDELAATAVVHVYERIQHFDPARATFATWCRTVLSNHCVSLIRREAAHAKRMQRHADHVAHEHEQRLHDDPPPTPLEAQETRAEQARRPRFDIVEALEKHLQPIDRILIVVYAELCSQCNAETLARWCVDAGGVDAAALPAVEALPKMKRKQALAALLGQKIDWVRQRIFRASKRLKEHGVGGAEA
ncbi:MAG: sigma-70 family RNA polymerase sigma factor [Planctomycetia bacterium]